MDYIKDFFIRSGAIDGRYLLRQTITVAVVLLSFLSLYGAYLQYNIFTFRTLLFPALLSWSAIGLVFWDAVQFFKIGRRENLLIHLAFVASIVFSIDRLERWRISWEAEAISQLAERADSGKVREIPRARDIDFDPPALEREIANSKCGEPIAGPRSLGSATYYLRCGSYSLVVDFVPLWSKFDLHVRQEGRRRGE